MTEKTILLIEDEETTSSAITQILKNEGFNVIITSDYNSSLNIINKLSLDLIIADEVLPHADGFGIVEYIRRNPRLSHLPVIQITNGKKPGFSFNAKPDAIISKPVEADKLLLLISSCFTHKQIKQVS